MNRFVAVAMYPGKPENMAWIRWRMSSDSKGARLVCAVLLLALSACNRVETPKVTPIPIRLRVGADSATAPLMRSLIQAFQQKNPDWEFRVEPGVGSAVTALVADGAVDLGAVADLPGTPDFKPWYTDLAIDGVVLVVNAANPLASLTTDQTRDIFAGFRNEWAYFGAPSAGSIQVVVREDADGTRALFERVIMGDIAPTSSAVVMPTAETAINFVALNPGAIAYVPSGRVTAQPQPAVKMLTLDAQAPTVDGLASGRYALQRNTYLIARSEPRGHAREFVQWVRGEEAARIIGELGYAPLSP